jgi:hypothetical protein
MSREREREREKERGRERERERKRERERNNHHVSRYVYMQVCGERDASYFRVRGRHTIT